MAKGDIILSDKYGVNPSLGVCYWCGQDNGEILLLGKLKGDVEAPKRAIYNYNPCNPCIQRFEAGIALVEISTTPLVEHHMPIDTQEGQALYPTGKVVVLTPGGFEKIRAMLNVEVAPDQKKMYVEVGFFEATGLSAVAGENNWTTVPNTEEG